MAEADRANIFTDRERIPLPNGQAIQALFVLDGNIAIISKPDGVVYQRVGGVWERLNFENVNYKGMAQAVQAGGDIYTWGSGDPKHIHRLESNRVHQRHSAFPGGESAPVGLAVRHTGDLLVAGNSTDMFMTKPEDDLEADWATSAYATTGGTVVALMRILLNGRIPLAIDSEDWAIHFLQVDNTVRVKAGPASNTVTANALEAITLNAANSLVVANGAQTGTDSADKTALTSKIITGVNGTNTVTWATSLGIDYPSDVTKVSFMMGTGIWWLACFGTASSVDFGGLYRYDGTAYGDRIAWPTGGTESTGRVKAMTFDPNGNVVIADNATRAVYSLNSSNEWEHIVDYPPGEEDVTGVHIRNPETDIVLVGADTAQLWQYDALYL